MRHGIGKAVTVTNRRLRQQGQHPGVHLLLWLCGIMLLAGSLAPPGYMPGSIADGWPVVLCPEGLPPGFLSSQNHHEHHHNHPGASDNAGSTDVDRHSYCPLGSALDKPATVSAPLVLSNGGNSFMAVSADIEVAVSPWRHVSYHPRDPPHSAT